MPLTEEQKQKERESYQNRKPYYREYARKNSAKRTATAKKWLKANNYKEPYESHAVHSARARAKKKNIPCTISRKDIHVPSVCPILNIPIVRGVGVLTPNSPSLDRVNPSLGYVPGNVWVISHRANMLKSNATVEELEAVVAAMKERRWEKET